MSFEVSTVGSIADQIDCIRLYAHRVHLFSARVNIDNTDGNGNLLVVFVVPDYLIPMQKIQPGPNETPFITSYKTIREGVIGIELNPRDIFTFVLADPFQTPLIEIHNHFGEISHEEVVLSYPELVIRHVPMLERDLAMLANSPGSNIALPLTLEEIDYEFNKQIENVDFLRDIFSDVVGQQAFESGDQTIKFLISRFYGAIYGYAVATDQDRNEDFSSFVEKLRGLYKDDQTKVDSASLLAGTRYEGNAYAEQLAKVLVDGIEITRTSIEAVLFRQQNRVPGIEPPGRER